MTVPKKCPMCGVEGAIERDGRFLHCTDYHCGYAWPAPKTKAGKRSAKKPSK